MIPIHLTLKSHQSYIRDDEVVFSLNEIKAQHKNIRELVQDTSWLVVEEDEYFVNWAVFVLVHSSAFGEIPEDTFVNVLCHGHGTGGALREMRHTFFGDQGYCFYLPIQTLIMAMYRLDLIFDSKV